MVSTRGRYSPNEIDLINLLSAQRGQRVNSLTIVSLHYQRRRRPAHAQRSVVSVLNSLAKKVRRNREDFRIGKTKRCGPYPIEYWMEPNRGLPI